MFYFQGNFIRNFCFQIGLRFNFKIRSTNLNSWKQCVFQIFSFLRRLRKIIEFSCLEALANVSKGGVRLVYLNSIYRAKNQQVRGQFNIQLFWQKKNFFNCFLIDLWVLIYNESLSDIIKLMITIIVISHEISDLI